MKPISCDSQEHDPAHRPVRTRAALAAAGAWALLALGGCASLPTAQVAVPAELAAAPSVALPAAHGRTGSFTLPAELGGSAGRFTRGADRLSLFESLDFDRAALTLQLDGDAADYRCTLRRTGVQLSVLAVPMRPMQLRCREAGGAAGGDRQLQLDEQQRTTRVERQGQYRAGALVLEIESMHRVQGSPLPLQEAGGYLLSHGGRPVALLDLLDRQPRLRSAAATPELRRAVREVALLLALHWDPAGT
jgi:hypothetical protein